VTLLGWDYQHTYYDLKAKFRVWIVWPAVTCLWFMRLAWKSLLGRLLVIDAEEARSKNGFNYCIITISKSPLSKEHTYEDIK